jgi:hypothetical protein
MFVELPAKKTRRKTKLAVDFADGGSIEHNVSREKGSVHTDDPALALEKDTSEAETTLEESVSFAGFPPQFRQPMGNSSHHSTNSAKRSASNVPSIPEDDPSLQSSFAEDVCPLIAVQDLIEAVKHVAFSIIEIQEYAIIAGDNPAVSKGAPLTIDWTPGPTIICTVDQYEGERRYTRSQLEMMLSMTRRHDVLRKVGFSVQEIMEYSRKAAIARNRRKKTTEQMKTEALQYNMELMYRAIRNATWNRSNKQRESEWLKQWRSLTLLQLQAPKAEDKRFYDSGNAEIVQSKKSSPPRRTLSPTAKIQQQSLQRPSAVLNSSLGTELTHMSSSMNLSNSSFHNNKSAMSFVAPDKVPEEPTSKPKANQKVRQTPKKKKKKVPNSIKKKQRLNEQGSVNLWLSIVGENR